MDRTVADGALSDVSAAEAPAGRGRDGETLYRRPPVQVPPDAEPAPGTTGSTWFGNRAEAAQDGARADAAVDEAPADDTRTPSAWSAGAWSEPPRTESARAESARAESPRTDPPEPRYGPAPPATSGRTSFGFSAGPISPGRTGPASTLPARGTPVAAPSTTAAAAGSAAAAGWDVEMPAAGGWPAPAPSGTGEFPAVAEAAIESPRTAGYSTGSFSTDSFTPMARSVNHDWPDNPVAGPPAGRNDGPRRDRPEAVPSADEPAPRQSRLVTLGMALLGVVVLLAGTVIGVVYFSGDDNSLPAMLSLGGSGGGKRTVSAPLDHRTSAGFELLAGVNTVHVGIGELGDDLYRISTPDDAGIKPSPVVKGDDVQLQVTRDGDGTGGEIEVVLSAAVRWQLRFSGYADQQVIDLSNGQVSSLEMVAGMRRAQLELPTPSGTVPVRITGAVDQLTVRSPADSPVRVKVGGGATTVVAGSRTLRNMPAGSTLTPKDWKTQSNRYDVTASSAIGSLNVENLTQ